MISYDTNILIYALESECEFSERSKDIMLQGEHEGAALSVLVWQEFMNGLKKSDVFVFEKIKRILSSFGNTKFVGVDQKIAEKAVTLSRNSSTKLRNYDAILVATAIEHGASEFWTNDKELLSLKIDEIKMCPLVGRM